MGGSGSVLEARQNYSQVALPFLVGLNREVWEGPQTLSVPRL